MNFTTVTCPHCRQRLTVSINAPRIVTCPTCLGKVENPGGAAPGQAPLPVIPIERQVASDAKVSHVASLAVAAVTVFGLILVVTTQGMNAISILLLAMVVVAAVGAWMLTGFPLWGNIKPAAN